MKTTEELRVATTPARRKGLDVRERPLLPPGEKCFLLTSPIIEPGTSLKQVSSRLRYLVFHFVCSRLFRISWLAGNCSQVVDSKQFIRIHVSRKGLAMIWCVFRGPSYHTIHTSHAPNCHTLHTSMTESCHTFHTSMYRSSCSRRARRDVKDPYLVHGMGGDRGKRHSSLSSR